MILSISINIFLAGLVLWLYIRQPIIKKKATEELFMLFMSGAYDNRIRWFKTMNRYAKKDGIVFIGDSLIEEWQLTEMFAPHPVYNRGIGGDTTDGILKRLDVSVLTLQPKHVFMLIGTNDIGLNNKTPHQIASSINTIIDNIHASLPNTTIHLISLLPVSEQTAPHIDPNTVGCRNNLTINNVNGIIKTFANQTTIIYHDVNRLLADDQGNLKDAYTREGLHLSPLAYETLVDYFINELT